MKPEINLYIKLINNLIIFDINKHLLYSPFLKARKKYFYNVIRIQTID